MPHATSAAAFYASSDSYRAWSRPPNDSGGATALPRSGDRDRFADTAAAVPVINLCPRRPSSGPEEEGFADANDATGLGAFYRRYLRDRPLRSDGQGGVAEFFVPGSPTFVRAAQPALLGLATLGGLAVLGTVLSV